MLDQIALQWWMPADLPRRHHPLSLLCPIKEVAFSTERRILLLLSARFTLRIKED